MPNRRVEIENSSISMKKKHVNSIDLKNEVAKNVIETSRLTIEKGIK